MTYKVLLHPKAAQELDKIGEPMRSRIKERLKELQTNPEGPGKKLKYSDYWSLRIGDHRAIYEIKADGAQVIVLFVGHRRDIYDDFSRIF
ncbi:MAG: type II toxin-antitoxin system RelE/ParE family toxin [Candidatus Bathyarchaeota archaeon]|nr:type II toxin-antitoxin system RelE/ParE family toxin [Candidatus Bathyarchaeota archaeon]